MKIYDNAEFWQVRQGTVLDAFELAILAGERDFLQSLFHQLIYIVMRNQDLP